MKKVFVFALLIFLFPIVTFGLEIDKVELKGENETSNGNDYNLEVNIGFTDLSKESTDMGIYAIEYYFSYDMNALIPVEINSEGYISTISKNGDFVVATNIYDKTKEDYLCKDKTLICTNFKSNIKFAVLDSINDKIEFKVNSVKVYTLPIEKALITESDVKTKTLNKVTVKDVKVNKVANTNKTANSIIVEENQKPKITTPKVGNIDSDKSSNVLLKNIVVEGYDLEFKNTNTDYKIIIPAEVKEVKVTCETEDPKAECKVYGNTNLDTNNTIIVKVTAENGLENSYTIKVNKLYEEGRNMNQDGLDRALSSINMNVLIIAAGVVLGLIVIVIIVDAVKSRKLEKKIDKFE